MSSFYEKKIPKKNSTKKILQKKFYKKNSTKNLQKFRRQQESIPRTNEFVRMLLPVGLPKFKFIGCVFEVACQQPSLSKFERN